MLKRILKGVVYFLGICCLISIICAACEDEEATTYIENTGPNEAVLVVPEEPDSEVKIAPKQETVKELNLYDLRDLIDGLAKDSFNSRGVQYSVAVDEENNAINFIVNLSAIEMAQSVNTSAWTELIDSMTYYSDEVLDTFKLLEREDVNFTISVGDISLDRYYILIVNSELIYNVENDL